MKYTTMLAAWMAFATSALAATPAQPTGPLQSPSTVPIPDTPTSQGCYNATGATWKINRQIVASSVSSGECRTFCQKSNSAVFAMQAAQCMCGNDYPPADSLVKDSECNYKCPAYPFEACGGLGDPGVWSVFNMGTELNVQNAKPAQPSSTGAPSSTGGDSGPTSSAAPTAAESHAATETVTDDKPEKSEGPNVAAIAGGVVVGVVLVAAGIGALFFFMRRRRNTEIEEEHRRNAAVNAFISGSKPPGSSGSISMTDSRLDPVLAHRRMSDGSIADNHDYSRKILRVTNA